MTLASSGEAHEDAAVGVSGLAAAIRERRISPEDVIEEHLDRLSRRNAELNAVVAVRAEAARREARLLAQRLAGGEAAGPLAGVPFTVKDIFATCDLPTTCGSRLMEDFRATGDATAVARMRAAGAILIGKTNCPEFAVGVDTANELHGRTKNPLGPFTPGGSSGGESAAIAAGMAAFGIGSDYGGSIRWPAQCTGLIGLRPTIGRVPATGQLPTLADEEPFTPNARGFQGRIQVVGPLAPSVADVEAVLRALAGPDGADSFAVPASLPSSADVRLGSVELRWGVEVAGIGATREVEDAVERAVDRLGRAGVSIVRGLPGPLDEAGELYSRLRATDSMAEIRHLAQGRAHLLGHGTRRLLTETEPVAEPLLVRLWARRDRLNSRLRQWLHGDRLLALPVAAVPPFDPTRPYPRLPGTASSEFDLLTASRVISLFGLPAVSVPCGRTKDGAPLSVQLVAPAFREDLVLAAARWLERVQRMED